jgi:beta-lactamase regulating signal transducer with metallopeptidase domain
MLFSDMLSSFSVMALQALIPGVALGIVLVIAVSAFLKMAGPFNAATRSVIWTLTLAALPIIPVLYFAAQVRPAPQPIVSMTSVPPPPRTVSAKAPVETPAAISQPSEQRVNIPVPRGTPAAALGIYAGVVLLLLIRLLISYARICRIRRRTRPAPADVAVRLEHWLARCPVERQVELRLSDRLRSPMAIGFRRPMIVMPAALVLEMSIEEFDDLGVHELAHIHRYDDWMNLFQRILQAFLFFHPAAYWVGRKLNFEREVACDDWVVSTNGPKSYAKCLAKIVELRRWQRGAALASGAFFGKRQILRRVEMLLDKTRNAATEVSIVTVAAVLVALAGITMRIAQLPAVIAVTQDDPGSHTKARWKDDTRDLKVDLRGEISLSTDERSIASLSPWGYIEIEEVNGWSRRRVEVRPSPSGVPEEKYFLDGRQRPLDQAARDWLGTMYPLVARELGIDIEGRVDRILASHGAAGVIQEVHLIHADQVKRKYLTQLLDRATLTTEDLRRVAMCARKISSDHDKAEFLLANARRFASDPLRTPYFQAVDSISSDYDRRRVLVGMLEADGASPETASRVGQSAKSMHSDHDKAEVLLAIPAPSEDSGCAPLMAARTIQSDFDKARVLRDSAYLESSACRDAFFTVVNLIRSDNDRSTVLRELLGRPGLEAATYENTALAAKTMSSDNDKANVLLLLGRHYAEGSFFEAVNTIRSDNDRKRVLNGMLESRPAKAVLLGIVDSASSMSSDHDKADVLIAVAKTPADSEVRSAVERACGKVRSDNDYRRVASALFNDTVNDTAESK